MPSEPSRERPSDPGEPFLATIAAEYQAWNQTIRRGVVDDLVAFLRGGPDLGVVQELSGSYAAQDALWAVGPGTRSRELYGQIDTVPVPMLVRWGETLAATAAGVRNPWHQACRTDSPRWAHALLAHVEHQVRRVEDFPTGTPADSGRPAIRVSHPRWEAWLTAAGEDPGSLLVAAFRPAQKSARRTAHEAGLALVDSPGYSDALRRHAGSVRAVIDRVTTPSDQESVLRLLERGDDDVLALFAAELARWATGGRGQVRRQAARLLDRCGARAEAELAELARDKLPGRRRLALSLLYERAAAADDDPARERVRALAAADRAESVRALADRWTVEEPPPGGHGLVPDTQAPISWVVRLTPEQDRWLTELVDDINAAAAEVIAARGAALGTAPSPGSSGTHGPAIAWDAQRHLRDYLASPSPAPVPDVLDPRFTYLLRGILGDRPALGWDVAAVVKLVAALGGGIEEGRSLSGPSRGPALTYALAEAAEALHAATGRPTLLELWQALISFGADPRCLLTSYADAYLRFARRWPQEDVEPCFARLARNGILTEQLAVPDYEPSWAYYRPALFTAAAMVRDKPPALRDLLYEKAFGSAKGDRGLAQQALAEDAELGPRIVAALGDGRAPVRTAAAQWAGRLRLQPALAEVERAAVKERHDVAKAAMLDALEKCGRPVGPYLHREQLPEQAARGLAKGIPAALHWFPWDALPPVRWADTGEQVADDVLRWWLVQAVKLKTAEPGAMMRRYCALLDAPDREDLGRAVLRAWSTQDLKQLSSLERFVRGVQGEVGPEPGSGSGVAAKGLLAVVAACGSADVVRSAADYITTHYGTRAAQGKALIAMLGWSEHPAAVQFLLAVRRRFRTAGFREEAARQIDALAERRGWTVEELADRTVPSAGLDDDGRLELPFGSRTFTAVLDADLTLGLRGPGGTRLPALPAPRSGDDDRLAAEAKRLLSGARKDLKALVKQQTDRLHEAMCVQRAWSFMDWDTYLHHHPVLRRLTQRLVWAYAIDGRDAGSFRPLDDGTLTDHLDAEVRPPCDAVVRIAHDLTLDPDDVTAWQSHLVDYQVAPLFRQLGRGAFRPTPERADQTALDDVDGVELSAFTLRSRAAKRGYARGAPVDGGWFVDYVRSFPGRGIDAVLEFSGSHLPEEDRPVTLKAMTFQARSGRLTLGEVPPVLLSECYHDLTDLAGRG